MHPEKYIPSFLHISFHFKVFRDLEGFWTCNRQVVSLWENLSKDSDLKCCFLDTVFSAARLSETFTKKVAAFHLFLMNKNNYTNSFIEFF